MADDLAYQAISAYGSEIKLARHQTLIGLQMKEQEWTRFTVEIQFVDK